ncbi:G2/mitotic-specific cyclin-B2-like [Cimex lectularius]|uniref:Cyclin B n=1 Tax=Cimex lectularius TaxID=79782 RepID=A0A8I6RQE3_CIMLE|nr:G2/mitotic-specific cyclin-B2-like [Cimex lectularius]
MATSGVRTHRATNDNENTILPAKGKIFRKVLTQRAALGEIGNTVTTKHVAKKENLVAPIDKCVQSFKDLTTLKDKPKENVAKERAVKGNEICKTVTGCAGVKPSDIHLKVLNLRKDWLKTTDLETEKKIQTHDIPAGVENIDEQDADNLFLLSSYVFDIFEYLKSIEKKYAVRPKHLSHLKITGHMRATLIDWLVDVQVEFNLIQETFQMAVSILDRYLQEATDVTGDNLQLVGIGCLFIACKYEETYPPEIEDFVYMSNSAFLRGEILEMECKILKCLEFNLGKPVPIIFLRRYSRTISAEPMQHSFAKYFIELALLDYKFACERPSLIAAAALHIGRRISLSDDVAPNAIWNPTIAYYSGYALSDIEEILPRMALCIKQASLSKLKAVHNKFSSSIFHKVSLSPHVQPNSGLLDKLINGKFTSS